MNVGINLTPPHTFFLVLHQLVISYEKKAKGKYTKQTSTESFGYTERYISTFSNSYKFKCKQGHTDGEGRLAEGEGRIPQL